MALFTPVLKFFWKENAKSDYKRLSRQTPAAGVHQKNNLPYLADDIDEHTLDIYYPEGTSGKLPVIIDIHGGGWMAGSKEINKNYCLAIAKRGYCVFNINYRLAESGKSGFKEQIEDIFSAFEWIYGAADNYPADIENCFLTGDSAGGHLAFCAAAISNSFILRQDFCIGEPLLKFKTVGAVSPAADLISPNITMNINLPELLGKKYKNSKYYKYMDANRIGVKNMPPFYIVTSSGDFLHSHAYKMKKALDRLGVKNKLHDFKGKYSGRKLPHVFSVLDPNPSYSRECIDEMLQFFKDNSKDEKTAAVK